MPPSEPQVPGAFGRYPSPHAVAIKRARRGFAFEGGSAGRELSIAPFEATSAFCVFIFFRAMFGIVEHGFVKSRLDNYVFLAGPCAQVDEPAAFTAERKIGVNRAVGGDAANGATQFHREFWNSLPRTHPRERRLAIDGKPQARIGKGFTETGEISTRAGGPKISVTRPKRSYSFEAVISMVASVPGGGSSEASVRPANSVT